MQITVYGTLLGISAIVSFYIALVSLRHRTCRGSREFVLMMLAVGWWSAMAALEDTTQVLAEKVFCSVLSYPGSQLIPVFFLLFSLAYTEKDRGMSLNHKMGLCILPLVSIILVATNGWHHLVWEKVFLTDTIFAGISGVYAHGIWYWVEVLYTYLLFLLGIGILLHTTFRNKGPYLKQNLLLSAAVCIPLIGQGIYAIFIRELDGIDPTPALLSLAGIIIGLAMYRFDLFDLVPIGREQVIESMAEGMAVIDQPGRIVDMNPSLQGMLSVTDTLIGRYISEIIPGWPVCHQIVSITGSDGEIRNLAISCSDIKDHNGTILGTTLIFRDVTSEHQMQTELMKNAATLEMTSKALCTANIRLQLMTSITRHDILNQITVQRGYLDLAMGSSDPNLLSKAIHRAYDAAGNINDLISFTKECQEIGTQTPLWLNLGDLIRKISGQFRQSSVQIINEVPEGVAIFADPLLEKVLYTLLDNAIRYGVTLTSVWFKIEKDRDTGRYTLICEDDGQGIPADEKEKIFRQGYGKNTGFGLFLSKEILAVNECVITETGVAGGGARFEIQIPPERYKRV
ncbi:MAG TPA: histidine kinase N-terminal 7TM domain-containing protein [Methanospirillum sp.]|nr:histidine kinase N-terminal 7TM domain-containing protein [Methanospirillum sp.]